MIVLTAKEFFYTVLSNARCAVKQPIRFASAEVTDLLTVDGEFYHRTATCAGSMTLDMPEAMDLANEVHYDEERLRGCNRAF